VQAITLTVMAVCIVGGFLGLRAVIWRQDYQVVAMIQSGILVSAAMGGPDDFVEWVLPMR